MKKKRILIISLKPIAISLKRAIEIILGSTEVDIHTYTNNVNLPLLFKKVETYDLVIIFPMLLNHENRNEEQKLVSFIKKNSNIKNYIYLKFPFKLNLLLKDIKKYLHSTDENIQQIINTTYLKEMYIYLIKIIFHDMLRTSSLNIVYFKKIVEYKNLSFWAKEIFNVNINEIDFLTKDSINAAINELEKNDNAIQLIQLSDKLKTLIIHKENSTVLIEKKNIFNEFVNNTKDLISLLNRKKNQILSINKKDKDDFSKKAAKNFWLCWWMWKKFEFMNDYKIFFGKTFYKKYFHAVATAINLEKYDLIKEEFEMENWNQVISILNRELNFIKKQYKVLLK